MNVRELTEYEKQKWFDQWNIFTAPEFLMNGDELGEAYETMVALEHMGSYISDELELHLATELLEMYYYQMAVYPDEYGGYEDVESLGLPPHDLFQEKLDELDVTELRYYDPDDKMREAWDWAVDWRTQHWQESQKKLRAKRLREEADRLENA